MATDEVPGGSVQAQPRVRLLAVGDLWLSVGCVMAAVVVFFVYAGQDAVGFGMLTSIWLLLSAGAFLLAHFSLKRRWKTRWLVQIPGPALIVFLLFGALLALALVVVCLPIAILATRKAVVHEGAA